MWLCCTLAYGASVLARHVGLAVAGRLAGWQGMDDWLSPLSVHACVRMRCACSATSAVAVLQPGPWCICAGQACGTGHGRQAGWLAVCMGSDRHAYICMTKTRSSTDQMRMAVGGWLPTGATLGPAQSRGKNIE